MWEKAISDLSLHLEIAMSFLELRAKVRKEDIRHPLILALHHLILLDSQFSAPSSKALKKSTLGR
jgi:hypothetical protein